MNLNKIPFLRLFENETEKYFVAWSISGKSLSLYDITGKTLLHEFDIISVDTVVYSGDYFPNKYIPETNTVQICLKEENEKVTFYVKEKD